MSAIAIGAQLVGSVVSSIGQIQQGNAAQQAAELNARNSEQNARDAVEQAKLNEYTQRQESRKILGGARAAYGASGVKLEGSPLDVLEESARNAELDALTIRYGGKVKSAAYNREADILRMEGTAAKRTSRMQAAGTFLSGVTSGLSKLSS